MYKHQIKIRKKNIEENRIWEFCTEDLIFVEIKKESYKLLNAASCATENAL